MKNFLQWKFFLQWNFFLQWKIFLHFFFFVFYQKAGTWHLPEGVVHVDVHGPDDGRVDFGDVGPREFVGLHDALLVPVRPVEPVLEHRHRKNVLDVGCGLVLRCGTVGGKGTIGNKCFLFWYLAIFLLWYFVLINCIKMCWMYYAGWCFAVRRWVVNN